MLNYLNRTNIAQARLNTFDEDLNLKDGDYQVCSAGISRYCSPLTGYRPLSQS